VRLPEPFKVAGDHIGLELAGARALFTTRRGGHSTGPFESLNLGLLTADRASDVRRNRARLAGAVGGELSYIRQVHGTTVIRRDRPQRPAAELPEADGQATATVGVAPMVMTADCLPIVIAAGSAVAVLHAGWRGLARGVIAEGILALGGLGDGGRATAAIGPGAGACCYEVGEEVHDEFAAHGERARHGRNLDLKAIARAELEAAGVDEVHDVGLCTICADPTWFFSHRRDQGITGRQAGIAWLT
jgi:YfiH family protein